MPENIQPGDKVKDLVSGLEGIVIGRTKLLTGCDRLTIQLPPNKDGRLEKEQNIYQDVNAVDLVEAQVVKPHGLVVKGIGDVDFREVPPLRNPSGPAPG